MADTTQTIPRPGASVQSQENADDANGTSTAIVQSTSRRQNRSWAYSVAAAGIALLALPFSFLSTSFAQAPIDPTDYALRTKNVLKTTPLIDGHNDLPWLIRVELHNRLQDKNFDPTQKLLGHTDIARMRQGMMGGQFWSVYVHCDTAQEHFESPSVRRTKRRTFLNVKSDLYLVGCARHLGTNRCRQTLHLRVP
jgi:membrane dipeptidase